MFKASWMSNVIHHRSSTSLTHCPKAKSWSRNQQGSCQSHEDHAKKIPSKNATKKKAKKLVAKALKKKRSEDALSWRLPNASTKAVKAKKHRVIKTNALAADKACTTTKIVIGSTPITLVTEEPVSHLLLKKFLRVQIFLNLGRLPTRETT
ncbi:hypothetical protein D8674_028560 [Pyrus ussuriensis x Pyrus communis]|uniref:Uncharacterized protein n=1 Tax=Pyrus ussuriensis x Pyrus communis TaxID=2448454 RepID=A0A5N5HZM3_9ROSA|nr:hypothetical protein D8674_028560 [Pyrus ussuriensis x Pyrus communis]